MVSTSRRSIRPSNASSPSSWPPPRKVESRMRADPLFPDELAGELNMPIIDVAAGVVATVRRVLTRTVRPRRFIVDDTGADLAAGFLIHSIKFGAVEQFVMEQAGIPAEIFSPIAIGNEIDFDTIPAGL